MASTYPIDRTRPSRRQRPVRRETESVNGKRCSAETGRRVPASPRNWPDHALTHFLGAQAGSVLMASVIKTMRGVMKSGNQVPMECGDLSDSIAIQKSESGIPNGGILFPSEFWILASALLNS